MNVRVADARPLGTSPPSWLSREYIVAKPGFNRWLVPPAALAIHLCIGMAYGFSVFWLPLSRSLGITASKTCPDLTLLSALVTTTCDWRVADLGWMYTLFFVFLGASAAVFGGWLERAGPRKAGIAAALCWCGGMAVSALGIITHQLWMMWLGSGVIGGIGLGLGYISPVSTLIKWFPDRRGMATGMAIMGFGGGALIGSPLAAILMDGFKTPTSVGVWQTFLVMAAGYFVFMMAGALGYRVPPAGWKPEGWTPPPAKAGMITHRHVHLKDAHKTVQFWLIWAVLCLNVSAGIGVIGIASPMLQEIFGGRLLVNTVTCVQSASDDFLNKYPNLKRDSSNEICVKNSDVKNDDFQVIKFAQTMGLKIVEKSIPSNKAFSDLSASEKAQVAAIAAGFVGLLSLFNIGGRFFWASLSDKLGRKTTYAIFFALGIALYAGAPSFAAAGSQALFVLAFCIILSMYGGGFATVPAYLADIFGTQFVGAIHGRLLTAWSTAGIVGPVVVNYIRQAQVDAGVSGSQLYDRTMYILAGMLALGFVANLLVRPLKEHWFMKEADVAALEAKGAAVAGAPSGSFGIGRGGLTPAALAAWAVVGIPIAWGVWNTLSKALIIFR